MKQSMKRVNNYHAIGGLIAYMLIGLCSGKLSAQYNLVNNFSFEDYPVCPSFTLTHLPHPYFWYYATREDNSAYYNSCAGDTLLGVPHNWFNFPSFQAAKSGNGYVIANYLNGIGSNYRNYYQTKLKDSLRQGHCYYGEYYVSLTNHSHYSSNNIAMLFTNNPVYNDTVTGGGFGVLSANPQIINYGNPIVSDTLNWIKVSCFFIAQGGEQYLTFGNFKYDSQTSYNVIQPGGNGAASYYVDDISVIPLDSFPLKADAGPDTTIALGDSVFIGSLTNGIPNITWYNMSGAVIDTGRPGFFVAPTTTTTYIIQQTVCGYTSRDTVTVTVNLMPLHWLSFIAEVFLPSPSAEGSGVRLRWQTANETNVSHINIQRSFRGTNEFQNIGQITAKNKPHNEYTYIDNPSSSLPPLGSGSASLPPLGGGSSILPPLGGGGALYRLQSIDKDGMRSYSEIRRVVFNEQAMGLNIYPNPATGMLNLEYKKIKQVSILDATGREVLNKMWDGSNDKIQLNISNLPRGLYILKAINNDNNIQSQKLIKNNQ